MLGDIDYLKNSCLKIWMNLGTGNNECNVDILSLFRQWQSKYVETYFEFTHPLDMTIIPSFTSKHSLTQVV